MTSAACLASVPMSTQIRTLGPDDHAAGQHLRVQAFSDQVRADPPGPDDIYIPDDRRLGAFVDGRMVGHGGAWQFGQHFLGREVRMGGVGGVAIAPEARGSGIGRELMRGLTDLMRTQGDAVSMLYPSLPGFYRQMGWEFAGWRMGGRVATAALRDLPAPAERVEVVPLDADRDRAAVRHLVDREAARGHGRIRLTEGFHDRGINDDGRAQYVVWRKDELVGHLAVGKRPAGADDNDSSYRQHVSSLVAADHDTWLALWRVVASSHPVCDVTTFASRPHEPLNDVLPTMAMHVNVDAMQWMLRLLDVGAAMAQRGWPDGADVEVHLNILDQWIPANAGPQVLRVADGRGSLEAGGRGDVSLGVGALAQLYTGFASAADLAWSRRINNPADRDVHALDEAFRSPLPWAERYF